MNRAFLENIITLLAVSISVYIVCTTIWGPYKTTIVHYAIFLGAMLIIFFWSASPLGKSPYLFYIDTFLVICVLITGGYVVFFWSDVLAAIEGSSPTIFQTCVDCGIIRLVLEAVRRVSVGLFIITLVAIAFILFGNHIPGPLSHTDIGLKRFVYLSAFSFEGIFGLGLSVASSYLLVFILFGSALEQTAVADFFLKLMDSMVGQTRGAPARCAVVASGLMGTVSGSSIANVVTVGSITIPLTKKMGLKSHVAAAIEVFSSVSFGMMRSPAVG